MSFTREQIIEGAFEKYGHPVCTDFIEDALRAPTLEEAIQIIVDDTFYWDGGYTGCWKYAKDAQ